MALGRASFALGVAGLGLLNLILRDFLPDLQPMPDWLAGRAIWASLTGLVLLMASAGIAANWRSRLAAIVMAVLFFVGVALLHLPKLIAAPGDGGAWVSAFELIALAGAALVIAAESPHEPRFERRWNGFIDGLAIPGLTCFGLSSAVFGTVHVIYAKFLASMIPAWIPGSLAWSYLIGTARVAAGVSIVTRVKARLAAMLLALMYGTWVLILHVPRVAAEPVNPAEWSFMFLAVAFCGGAWVIAVSWPGSALHPRVVDAPRAD